MAKKYECVAGGGGGGGGGLEGGGRGGRGAVTFSRRSIYDYIVLLRYRLKKPRT